MTARTPRVKLDASEVRGTTADGVDVYWGIPFAAPPLGALRFAAPEPVVLPAEVDARSPRAGAPQIESVLGARIGIVSKEQSEDCLHLNVWTNARAGDTRPVIFWIHGGGFDTGSATNRATHASRLVERTGAVVVTVQYRLGALGFLCVDGAPDNRALLDQKAALRFVRRYIGEFGGDPENVTAMGSSAGAACALLLALDTEGKTLLRRVIAHSGHVECVHTVKQARRLAQAVYRALGWPEAMTGEDARTRLASVPIDQLLRAQKHAQGKHGPFIYGLTYQPVYRDVSPLDHAAAGAAAGVDVIIGNTSHEYRLARLAELGQSFGAKDLQERTSHLVSMARGHERLAKDLVDQYRSRPALADAEPLDVWSAIGTDYHFRYPASRLARRLAEKSRVYTYDFAFKTRSFGGLLGAVHAMEIPYVFGTYDTPLMRLFLAETSVSPRLSNEVQDAWTAFARGKEPTLPNGDAWPALTATRPRTAVIDDPWSVVDDAYGFAREVWGPHWPVVAASGPSGDFHSVTSV